MRARIWTRPIANLAVPAVLLGQTILFTCLLPAGATAQIDVLRGFLQNALPPAGQSAPGYYPPQGSPPPAAPPQRYYPPAAGVYPNYPPPQPVPTIDPQTAADMQRMLQQLGYDAGAPDGAWGERSSNALRSFQAAHGLAPDGLITPASRAAVARNFAQTKSARQDTVPTGGTPSFDCTRASLASEKAICRDPNLAALDRDLDNAYAQLRASATPEAGSALVSEQRAWTARRNECGADPSCLRQMLTTRVATLRQEIAAGPAGGMVAAGPAVPPGSESSPSAIVDAASAANGQTAAQNWRLPTVHGLPVLDLPISLANRDASDAWRHAFSAMGVAALPDPARDVSDRRAAELACMFLDERTRTSLYGRSPLYPDNDVCRSLIGTPQIAVEPLLATGGAAWRAQSLPELLRSAPGPGFGLMLRAEATLDNYDRATGSYRVYWSGSGGDAVQLLGSPLDAKLPDVWRVSEQEAIAFETRRGRQRPLKVYFGVPAVITGAANVAPAQPVDPETALPQGAVWTIRTGPVTLYDDLALERPLRTFSGPSPTAVTAATDKGTGAGPDAQPLANAREAAQRWGLRTQDGMLLLRFEYSSNILSFGNLQQGTSPDFPSSQREALYRALIAASLAAAPDELAAAPDTAMRQVACELLAPQRRTVLFGKSCQNSAGSPMPGQEFALHDAVATFRSVDLPTIMAQAPHLPLAFLMQTDLRFDPWDQTMHAFRVGSPSQGSPTLFGSRVPFAFPRFWPATETEARAYAAGRPLRRTMGGSMVDYTAVLSVPVTFTGLTPPDAHNSNWVRGETGLWNNRAWQMKVGEATLYSDPAQTKVLYRYGTSLNFPAAVAGTPLARMPHPAGAVPFSTETPVLLAQRPGNSSLPEPDWARLARDRLGTESYLRTDPNWAQRDPWGVYFVRGPMRALDDLSPAEVAGYRDWTIKRAAALPETLELRQDTPPSDAPRQIRVLDRQTASSWIGSPPSSYQQFPQALRDRGIAADQLLPVQLIYPVGSDRPAAPGRNTGSSTQPLPVLLAVPQPWNTYVLDATSGVPAPPQNGGSNPVMPTLGVDLRVVSLEDITLAPATTMHALLLKLEPVKATVRSAGVIVASTSFPASSFPAVSAAPAAVVPAVTSAPAPSLPAPAAAPRPDPEQRVAQGPYGPDMLGLRIGMATSEAEQLIRAHMKVARVLETEPAPPGAPPELHAKLFVSSDRATSYFSEEIAIYDAPSPQNGKVIAAWRTLYVSEGMWERVLHGLTEKYGMPKADLSWPKQPAWGDGNRDLCISGGPGRWPAWVENGQSLPRRPDAMVQANTLPRPPAASEPRDRYQSCGPTVAATVEGSESMADGRPLQRFTTKLFDIALLARMSTRWATEPLPAGSPEIKY